MNRMESAKRYIEKLYNGADSPLEATDPEFAAIKKRLI